MTRRATTRDRLLRLVAKHPTWTAERFAARLGVTRWRVYQLLSQAGYRHVWQRAPRKKTR